ncbi:TetR/AcrR family transcriptional regulator [Humibacter albus]|jgi:AcrR family transcriptional regulator|uniref:TetR/AcrR family transcriptional regulator n=1 Tax=Humibacter albus TaxID=427754 RepID=UPI0003B6C591|nr:TetR/AcrR family transcriptional regulator [Humibacter albus]
MPRSTQAAERFSARGVAIVAAARAIAESDGWSAVTVRRLAESVGVSQPILYKHFPGGREQVVEQVVLDGSAEIAAALSANAQDDGILRHVVTAYFDYANAHPAVVEAMFTGLTNLRFASSETPPELLRGFAAIRRAVAVDDPHRSDLRAELLWSLLHGASELMRSGRLPAVLHEERVEEIVRLFGRDE